MIFTGGIHSQTVNASSASPRICVRPTKELSRFWKSFSSLYYRCPSDDLVKMNDVHGDSFFQT